MASVLGTGANVATFSTAGLALGGPIGAAIGAVVGLVGSLLGGHPSQGPALRAAADQASTTLEADIAQSNDTETLNNQMMLAAISALGAAVAVKVIRHGRS